MLEDIEKKLLTSPAKEIVDLIGKGKGAKLVFYLNAHIVRLVRTSETFRKIINQADWVYADGWGGVVWLRTMGIKVDQRATAPDFFDEVAKKAIKKRLSFYFLGAREEVISGFVRKVKTRFPKLKIAGWRNGYFSDDKEVLDRIKGSDILVVGMGADGVGGLPKQERWVTENRDKLKVGVVWCVGSFFDNYGKKRGRGRWYFEWWQRLKENPIKMGIRYFLDMIVWGWVMGEEWLRDRGGKY